MSLDKLKAELAQHNAKRNQLIGKRDTLLDRLKNEFGLKSFAEAEAEIDAIILIIILAIILCGTHANMEAIRGEDLLLLLLLLACSLVTETEIEIEMINAENESEILNMNMIMNKIAIENTGRQQLKSEKRIFPQRLYLHSNRNRNLSSSSYNNSSNISLSNSSNISLSLSDRCRRLKRVI